MHNDLITIGSFTLHTYGLMTGIGIVAAYFSAEYRARKNGLDHTKVFLLVIFCVLFGYLGSKILYFITIMPQIMADPSIIFSSLADGWVVYGGIIGGIFGGFLYCRLYRLPTLKFFDIGLASVALAQGFGRFGCFMAGCCYGLPTDGPIAVTFTNSQFAPNGVPLIPTQLFSSAGDFLLFVFMVLMYRRKNNKPGQCTSLYLICYGTGRFILEFFRGDLIRGSVGTISTSQFISIFIVAAGVIMLIVCTRATDKRAVMNACIFDLDGTLLNTVESIAHATNRALSENGLPEQPLSAYKYYIGGGYANAVKLALKDAGDAELAKFDAVYEAGKKYYEEDPLYKVEPYGEITETVKKLKKAGAKLAVLTNKPAAAAEAALAKFFEDGTFDHIRGQVDGAPLKPDSACADEILDALDVTADKCCYVGDSETDMKMGKAAGFCTIGVLWGYRTKKELKEHGPGSLINNPLQITEEYRWENIQKNA